MHSDPNMCVSSAFLSRNLRVPGQHCSPLRRSDMRRSMSSMIIFFYAFGLFFFPSDSKPVEKRKGEESFDPADYETVHGHILAVNLHHMKKRAVLENESAEGNSTRNETGPFQQIERANKDLLTKFYQGDIDLEGDDELQDYIKTGGNSRNALRERKRVWITRKIPYRIPFEMQHIASNVQDAIGEFHRKTCVQFVPYNRYYHENYIEFVSEDGCWSKVGKKYYEKGRQKLSIGDGCNFVGTILHEMMHALGFFHEQARSDRDRYVKIYWNNILDGFSSQFDKYTWRTIDDLGVSYDYQSIMHYDRRAFTKNGNPTIVAIGNENMEFKTPDFKLSAKDAIEINALYNCQVPSQSFGWTPWSGWTPCDDNCYRSRQRYCYHSSNIKSCGGRVNDFGVETESEKCHVSICPAPIDGNWGRWSDWGPCSKTCNDGLRTRFRKCNNPNPAHGGRHCIGSEYDKVSCILKRCTLDLDDTDFEGYRLGMWTNAREDELDWRFHQGYTKTMKTGPSSDHTTGTGYYLYVESSSTQRGQRARLVSPWQSASSEGRCMKLYYTMYGKTIGSLLVRLKISNGNSWLIFYERGDKGKEWKKGTGNIDVTLGLSYQLIIEATIGDTGYSDIAIDDVYIDPGLCSCQDDYFTCHIWAAKGECTTNLKWMAENCRRSCKVCRTAVKPPPPTTGVPRPVCNDYTAHKTQCPLWANNGECSKNPAFMLAHCKKSCNVCKPPCEDSNVSCLAWAKNGECTKNPAWMHPNCKLSCGQCG